MDICGFGSNAKNTVFGFLKPKRILVRFVGEPSRMYTRKRLLGGCCDWRGLWCASRQRASIS